jgi:hypothetical protein
MTFLPVLCFKTKKQFEKKKELKKTMLFFFYFLPAYIFENDSNYPEKAGDSTKSILNWLDRQTLPTV